MRRLPRAPRPIPPLSCLLLGACLAAACRGGDGARAGSAGAVAPGTIRIEAVMADPRDVADERGEWIRVRNSGRSAVRLGGWMIASGGDSPHRIAGDVAIPAGGAVVLARAAGARADGIAPG